MRALVFLLAVGAQAQTVFVHVNVFDGTRLLRNQTVILDNEVITGLGSKVAQPAWATVIEGRGKTLLPALIDAASVQRPDWIQLVYNDGFAWGKRHPPVSYVALHEEVERYHKDHKQVLVEVGSLRESIEALSADADGLLNIFAGAKSDPEFVRVAAKQKVFIIPVLAVLEAAVSKAGKPRVEGALDALKQLHDEHVQLLAGGPDLPKELELLVRDAGLSPLEALQAATSLPAKVFGLTDQGVILQGRPAKLLLVDGDPTVSIKVLRQAGSRVF